jgi:hypothetical protein
MKCALHGLNPHGQSLWCCPPLELPQPAPASLLATMQVQVHTCRYRHIHADTCHTCRYMQNFVRVYLACMSAVCVCIIFGMYDSDSMSAVCVCIILQYIQHTYTYNRGQSICSMYVYVLYVRALYLVHISCMSCICCAYCMYFLHQKMLGVTYRHDTYNTYRYIHICIEIHTSFIHICIAIHAHTCSSHRVFAQCICVCIVCIV